MNFLIWLVPSVFIIHDFEEIIMVENWLKNNEKDVLMIIPARFHDYFAKVFPKNTAGFSVAVLVEYIGILAATIVAVTGNGNPMKLIGTLAVVTILFLHCFTHIVQSVILKRYTPGVITAIVLLVPFSVYFYHYFLSKQFITWNMIWLSIPLGIILVVVLNQSGLLLGKRLVKQ
jgi:hypothetical protein